MGKLIMEMPIRVLKMVDGRRRAYLDPQLQF